MKTKLILALVALAGLGAALALAGPTQAGSGTGTTGTGSTGTGSTGTGSTGTGSTGTGATGTGTTTTGKHHGWGGHSGTSSCQRVELVGSNGSGSVAFTVAKASRDGSSFVGKQVTLNVPPGSSVSATACVDSAGALTLRGLTVRLPHAAPTTTTTSTSNDPKAPHGHGSHHH